MEDDVPATNGMNLDLNLGPMLPSSPAHDLQMDEQVSLDDWIERYPSRRRVTDIFRRRVRQRWRWQHLPPPSDARDITVELMGNSAGISGTAPLAGEGSTAAATEDAQVKMCENADANVEDETCKKEGQDEIQNDDKSFFDCNICLDLASEPVVTCCGHLFCWPCLYRWLHVHSDSKECPVCKGEVTSKNVTPIYGRGMNPRLPEVDSRDKDKIPTRPQARRVESLRQNIQRNSFSLSLEEMFRRLGSRFASPVDLFEAHDPENFSERSNSLLNRFLTSRGTRRENGLAVPSDDVADITPDRMDNVETYYNRHSQLSSLLLRRSQSSRAAAFSSSPSAFNPGERIVEAYFRSHHAGRNLEQPLPVEDRDSFSSIGAVIHSESQTLDTAVEIDSTVSLSTSSSRRRNDVSRASDVDSGDSRVRRRRRLN